MCHGVLAVTLGLQGGFRKLSLGELGEFCDTVQPEDKPINEGLEAGTATQEPFAVDELKQYFGDQLRIEGDRVHFEGELIKQMYDEVATPGPFPDRELNFGLAGKKAIELAATKNVDLKGAELVLNSQRMRHLVNSHGKPDAVRPGSGEHHADQIPLSLEDLELIPFLWRNPDSLEGKGGKRLQIYKEDIDRKTVLVTYERNQKTKTWSPRSMYIKKLASDRMQ